MTVNGLSEILVCGDQTGALTYRKLSTLDAVHMVKATKIAGAITWLSFSTGQYKHNNGSLLLFNFDPFYNLFVYYVFVLYLCR